MIANAVQLLYIIEKFEVKTTFKGVFILINSLLSIYLWLYAYLIIILEKTVGSVVTSSQIF